MRFACLVLLGLLGISTASAQERTELAFELLQKVDLPEVSFYKYPHEFEGHYVPDDYLPEAIVGARIYEPSGSGFELELRARRARLEAAKAGAGAEAAAPVPAPDHPHRR